MKTANRAWLAFPGSPRPACLFCLPRRRGHGYSRHAAPWHIKQEAGSRSRMPYRISHLQVRGLRCAA